MIHIEKSDSVRFYGRHITFNGRTTLGVHRSSRKKSLNVWYITNPGLLELTTPWLAIYNSTPAMTDLHHNIRPPFFYLCTLAKGHNNYYDIHLLNTEFEILQAKTKYYANK